MKLHMISCSLHGYQLTKRIESMLADSDHRIRQSGEADRQFEVVTKVKARDCENLTADYLKEQSVLEYVGEIFEHTDAILFICACGIAVRMIAPFVKHKATDPAVLVMDETAKFCIPLLSGHYGGANALAQRIAKLVGAEPVITTATDRQERFAVDVFARKNHLTIKDWAKVKQYSAEILGDNRMQLSITVSPYINHNTNTVWLVPRCIKIGIGCKKGTDKERIEEAVFKTLKKCNISEDAIKLVTSIDLKKNEPGLIKFCSAHQWMFETYTTEQLAKVKDSTSGSDFVKEVTGVDNVCERSALMTGGDLICKKMVYPGVTVALVMEEIILNW